ncbi:MAG: energy transducer TonB [Chitinophagaceae bacterium]
MKKSFLFNPFPKVFTYAVFMGSMIICCSFSVKVYRWSAYNEQETLYDTLPLKSPRDLNWNQIHKLISYEGELIALYGNDSLLIKRKEYEIYAHETEKMGDYNNLFTRLELEAEYPGGALAWFNYLGKNMTYPKAALDRNLQGTVVVRFIVDMEGKVSDIQAINGPTTGGLREEALRLVKASGDWHPGIQNFRLVRSYKKQAVNFSNK